MRVLHLGKFFPPVKGGMETILESICEGTSGLVENVVLVANDRRETAGERHGRVAVVRVAALGRIGAVAVCPTMPFWLSSQRADVTIIHEPNPMGLLSYFLARPPGALIVWFHSEVIRPAWRYRLFYRPLLQFALRRAARIVVASPTLATSAPELKEWQTKCVVIPYGIDCLKDIGSAGSSLRSAAIRAEHSRPVVLFVGRLVRYKGLHVLLAALRDVSADAVIVGDGPERAALQRQAQELGLAERVVFRGEVDDEELAALYDACDVFVLPSITRQEAFGVVQLEAMAHGKPVISTDLETGISWVNRHLETGLVVPPGDTAALRAAIQRLLGDAALRLSMGEAARQRVRAEFSVERMLQAAVALYREVVRGRLAANVA